VTPKLNVRMVVRGGEKAVRQLTMAKKEVQKTKPLWDKAVIILEMSHTKTFRDQGRPKWDDTERGGKILQEFNTLMQTVTARHQDSIREYGKTTLKFGTKLPYGPTHQFGFLPRNIKKRRFLGVYDEDIKKMEEVFEKDIEHRLEVVTSG